MLYFTILNRNLVFQRQSDKFFESFWVIYLPRIAFDLSCLNPFWSIFEPIRSAKHEFIFLMIVFYIIFQMREWTKIGRMSSSLTSPFVCVLFTETNILTPRFFGIEVSFLHWWFQRSLNHSNAWCCATRFHQNNQVPNLYLSGFSLLLPLLLLVWMKWHYLF